MVTLIIGLILLAIPFILMGLFSDKRKGFIYVLFFSFLFQTLLALLTQALGIFYYWVIASCTLLADIILIFIYLKIKATNGKSTLFSLDRVDWIIIAITVISLLSLYQVHYNYTGEMSLTTDRTVSYHEAKNMIYPYPYFSDEWYAVSLVEGAINNHSLPVKNILDNSFFPNLELFFHSFIAQITVLLGLNPLLHYTVLSIFLNALIIILIYLFLRISSIPKLTAGICSLAALYITYGANLPGLWQLIPFNLGIIFFLLSICFAEFGDLKIVFLSTAIASLFYLPLIPFYFLGLLVFFLGKTKMSKANLFKTTAKVLFFFFIAMLAFYIVAPSLFSKALNYVFSKIFFVAFMNPFMQQINFYDVIPLPAILLAILGLYFIYRSKKWVLLSELILGIIFWLVYAFNGYRFFIEYGRIAVITSVIAVIISGFGLFELEERVKIKFKKDKYIILKMSEAIILFIFLILVPIYTNGETWKKIISVDPVSGLTAYPKSPANNYLTVDDLKIFENIKNKRFLSVSWKGTTIGVATGNYPALTKQGTISIGSEKILNDFSNANCRGKTELAKKFKLDYIYLYQINCPGFQKIAESQEGFILYKTDFK